jgi:hypothetical protein
VIAVAVMALLIEILIFDVFCVMQITDLLIACQPIATLDVELHVLLSTRACPIKSPKLAHIHQPHAERRQNSWPLVLRRS